MNNVSLAATEEALPAERGPACHFAGSFRSERSPSVVIKNQMSVYMIE
jgi:hypothetical protein